MRNNFINWAAVLFITFSALGRDPLTDKNREPTGVPTEGLGQLLKDLPDNHPAKLSFNTMLKEIVKTGGHVHVKDLGAFTFGVHNPVGPNQTVFRYNPERLRAIDAMEEVLHWEQIKEGGAYWRDYSNHPMYKKFKGKTMIMEDLAKRSLLQRTDLPFVIREELKGDLKRVQSNMYSTDASSGCPVLFAQVGLP